MSDYPRLPLELLRTIVELAQDGSTQTLLSLLTCRTLQCELEERDYRKISIKDDTWSVLSLPENIDEEYKRTHYSRSFESLLKTLCDNRRLANYILTFETFVFIDQIPDIESFWPLFARSLSALHNLKEFECYTDHRTECPSVNIFRTCTFQLERFIWGDLRYYDSELANFLAEQRQLRLLHLEEWAAQLDGTSLPRLRYLCSPFAGELSIHPGRSVAHLCWYGDQFDPDKYRDAL